MTRDRDILLIGLALGGGAGALLYIAVGSSLQNEVRQAFMLIVGLLIMAALSAFSTYLASTPFLHATAIPANSAISFDLNRSSPAQINKNLTTQNGSDLDAIINEMHDQMRLLSLQIGAKEKTDQLSFVALATNLRYHGIIDDNLFQSLIFFRNTYRGFEYSLHADKGFIDVTVDIGEGLLHQLRDLNTANEFARAQTRRSS
ncbi:hypothetical protein ABZT49_13040 [Methylobacterium sp. EM32]|uniref:hypothetical protein n=1 Tax=Methylobacterium sp. EM32 TaxID=3163481 RepID=UPI0033A7A317